MLVQHELHTLLSLGTTSVGYIAGCALVRNDFYLCETIADASKTVVFCPVGPLKWYQTTSMTRNDWNITKLLNTVCFYINPILKAPVRSCSL